MHKKINNETKNNSEPFNPNILIPISLLGRGSFGEVYLVERTTDKELFALKMITKRTVISQNLQKYVKTERDVMSITKHPFIVPLHYAFQTSEKLFLVMEYCPGGDLKNLLSKETKLNEEVTKIYSAEIILALEELHKRDIIYRDLKPENIVFDSEGHAMLTDFGLSKEGVLDNLSAKSFCGSISYLAPEMLKQSGHGKSIDWYLLGVIIYEMLTGEVPFYRTEREQFFQAIQHSKLKIPPFITKEAKELLKGLLEKNPLKRLGSSTDDSEEIKQSSWFRDINWENVYGRQLSPPKPIIKQTPKYYINADLYDDYPEESEKILGWSFINKSLKNS